MAAEHFHLAFALLKSSPNRNMDEVLFSIIEPDTLEEIRSFDSVTEYYVTRMRRNIANPISISSATCPWSLDNKPHLQTGYNKISTFNKYKMIFGDVLVEPSTLTPIELLVYTLIEEPSKKD